MRCAILWGSALGVDLDIVAMFSGEKESVPFQKPYPNPGACSNAVEQWLLLVEKAMKDTVCRTYCVRIIPMFDDVWLMLGALSHQELCHSV